ncbi:MAG: tetratricopeptide repeat protein [Deltaproteobacteria bacterium]|nr:tetratricopeptide repeat protein [Deltaproteobacteria bacterium]
MAGASGRLKEAEQSFRQAIQSDPAAPQPLYNLGVVYERKGADLKALNYYQISIEKKGDYLPAVSAAAKILLRYGKAEQAVQTVHSASSKSPGNIKLLILYSDVLVSAQRYDDAIRMAKRALRIDERSAMAMLQIGKANLKMGRIELAESVFNQVVSINDKISEVFFLQGMLELRKGFNVLAIRKFEKAIEINPFYPEALNNLAIEYMLAGNYEDAIEMLERAIQITPSWGVLYLNYGNALRGAGRWKQALSALSKARKMLPTTPAITFNMAVLYYAADGLGGMSRMARLKKSRDLFARYKAEKGASLSKSDESFKYIKELDVLLEREQVRLQREREAAAKAKERQQAKKSNEAAGAQSKPGNDLEKAEDDGWE